MTVVIDTPDYYQEVEGWRKKTKTVPLMPLIHFPH
jgi:hypothetical protein